MVEVLITITDGAGNVRAEAVARTMIVCEHWDREEA